MLYGLPPPSSIVFVAVLAAVAVVDEIPVSEPALNASVVSPLDSRNFRRDGPLFCHFFGHPIFLTSEAVPDHSEARAYSLDRECLIRHIVAVLCVRTKWLDAAYSVEKLGSESNLVYLGEVSRVRDASF